MAMTNLTGAGTQMKTSLGKRCCPSMEDGLRDQSITLSVVGIFFILTAFLGNTLILVSLRRVSSLHPPSKHLYRTLATTDLLVGVLSQPLYVSYWMSIAYEHWSLCSYLIYALFTASYALCTVSLSTMTAISVDRLLALLLGLRYRHVVTLKRTYVVVTTFWVLSIFVGLCLILEHNITFWFDRIYVPSCLVITIASYAKIFHALSHHQNQVLDQLGQPNSLNMARYKKAVYSALWVQLALVACYAPYSILEIMILYIKIYPPYVLVIWEITVIVVFFNSTLNPLIYCWKIKEVRQAVKKTIRNALCSQ